MTSRQDSLAVVEWISDSEDAEIIPGGFFKEGMRWNDYIERFTDPYQKYLAALRKAILRRTMKITGEEHQNEMDTVPVFNYGKVIAFTMRGWGDLMAAIWSTEENKNYHYMEFYM